ncbi:MAG: flavodoxin family protein [Anaerofustis sp.]
MNIKVCYYSETGNTKKIAECIADALGVQAEAITDATAVEQVDLLFVGGFLRAFTLVRPTKQLLKSLSDASQTKNIAVFSTSASGKGIRKYADKYLKKTNIRILGDFACLGAYMKSNPGSPNESDCAHAAEFAGKILELCKNQTE